MAAKPILLACYDFPPNKGIGGRRWAKFAKGLVAKGYQIHVIKAHPVSSSKNSGWTEDISQGIIVHSLPRSYPKVVSEGPKTLIDKLKYRWEINRLQRKEKGTIYDIASGWKDHFLEKASEVIQNNGITNVIATGAPFNLLYYTALLKDEFPDLNIIADYRDPWLTAQNYGMQDLAPLRLEYETAKQELVMANANWITCPNEFLMSEIRSSAIVKPKSNFIALPHFYDPDDLDVYLKKEKRKDDRIKIVYGGAVYLGMEKFLKRLNEGLDLLKEKSPEIAGRLDIEIYTPHQRFASFFEGNQDIVQFKDTIGKAFFKELNSADAAFIFLAKHNSNFLTTKFFEYIPFRKPLFFLGAKGYVATFIEDNVLGRVLEQPEDICKSLKDLAENKVVINKKFDVSTLDLEHRTKQLMALFK